jgi:group I intron endonuclease
MNNTMSTTKEQKLWDENHSIEHKMKSENNGVSDVCDTTIDISELKENEHSINTTKISGIYKIINKINGKYYIGSSTNIVGSNNRWDRHKRSLNKNKHHNIHLQRAWNKYGKENFEFIIVEKISRAELINREQHYLNIAKKELNKCYNIKFVADGTNFRKSYDRYSIALKLFYKNNPEEKYKRTIACHTETAIHKRSISLKNYFKNNPDAAKYRGKMVRNYYINNPIEREKLSKLFRDSTIYTFKNINYNEIFTGTQFDFRIRYNLNKGNINNLIKGRCNIVKGWVLLRN